MSRRRAAEKRPILPDPKFNNKVITKFVSGLMLKGKRSLAEKILYQALEVVENKLKAPALDVFTQAMDNVKPSVEVRSRRVGGATYQVPMEVRSQRSQALAIRWIVGMARKRSEKTMMDRLAGELLDAFNNRGASIKKREDTHKMAEANRAFAHYRW